jgi:peptidoglycan/LPS O-acetylase OafA/YrhL
MAERLWLTAIIIAVIANLFTVIDPFNLQDNWLHRLHTNAFSLGILLVWLLRNTQWGEKLSRFRNESDETGRYVFIGVVLLFTIYMAAHLFVEDWSKTAQLLKNIGFNDRFVIEQTTSLLTMTGLIAIFSMKKIDNRFLSLFGVYSYETYLVHWPLMYRYDIFFHWLPAWLAVCSWLATFLAVGWLLQKVTVPLSVWIDKQF